MKNHLKAGLLGLSLISTPFATLAGQAPAAFDTPYAAFEAFRTALGDQDALMGVLGTDAKDVLSTGNPEHDIQNRIEVRRMVDEGYRFQTLEDGSVLIIMGEDGWPFPIPMTKTDAGWIFDIEAGRDEVFFRRVGLNELEAIDMLSAYVDIQSVYRLVDHDEDGVMEFAATIISDENTRSGLVWADEDSPLGERIALASLDGYNDGENDLVAEPFGGYYFRILQEQGDAAPGGAMKYVIGGNMVSGHAILAVPAAYGQTGIHTFMVSENGIVLEADLGENTLGTAFDMRVFNPDSTWEPVQ